jgi:hypothetical protein
MTSTGPATSCCFRRRGRTKPWRRRIGRPGSAIGAGGREAPSFHCITMFQRVSRLTARLRIPKHQPQSRSIPAADCSGSQSAPRCAPLQAIRSPVSTGRQYFSARSSIKAMRSKYRWSNNRPFTATLSWPGGSRRSRAIADWARCRWAPLRATRINSRYSGSARR